MRNGGTHYFGKKHSKPVPKVIFTWVQIISEVCSVRWCSVDGVEGEMLLFLELLLFGAVIAKFLMIFAPATAVSAFTISCGLIVQMEFGFLVVGHPFLETETVATCMQRSNDRKEKIFQFFV